MRVDQYGELVSEIYPPGPDYVGNLGNCMAETARYVNLSSFLNPGTKTTLKLMPFSTPTTYLQSLDPTCPSDWTDSSDQCMPWYIATNNLYSQFYANEMKQRIKDSNFRTPDGNLMSIPFFCLLFAPWALSIVVFLQALSLRVPISWGQREAAHLNWFQTALLCPLWVRKAVPEHLLRRAVWQYYSNEPNVDWLLATYDKAIEKAYHPV